MQDTSTSTERRAAAGDEPERRLARLLQLASPALPVGAYSYSQGLEAAIEAGVVRDAQSAQRWIGDVLCFSVARMEAPVFARLCRAWEARDYEAIAQWNTRFLASRESAELRAETVQMGYSLARLLADVGEASQALERLGALETIAFPTAFAFAVVAWQIAPHQALVAYLWAWLENQTLAALKALPLGQTEAQRMLLALSPRLAALAREAEAMEDEDLGNFTPGLAVFSSRHEAQYSRLFRS